MAFVEILNRMLGREAIGRANDTRHQGSRGDVEGEAEEILTDALWNESVRVLNRYREFQKRHALAMGNDHLVYAISEWNQGVSRRRIYLDRNADLLDVAIAHNFLPEKSLLEGLHGLERIIDEFDQQFPSTIE